MIDFNRENLKNENGKDILNDKLEENLKMQKDCEVEIERCTDQEDFDNLTKTKETLETLKAEETNIREDLEK